MRRKSKKAIVKKRQPFSLATIKLLAMCAMLAATAYGAFRLKDLPVTSVSIEGVTRAGIVVRIEDIVLPEISQGFFSISIRALQKRIQSLPWVEHATIRRAWPSQLVIHITEYTPLAEWDNGGVVTDKGQWIDVMPLPGDHLIRFAGPTDQAHRIWERYTFFQEKIAPLGLRIVRVELAERGAWSLSLDNGISLALGRQDVEARFERFLDAYTCRLASLSSNIRSVDLRYTQGLAVGWRGEKEVFRKKQNHL